MIGRPEGVRKLLVAYDVEGYGGRGKRLELATQQRLVDVLTYAFGEARVPPDAYEMQEQGDGGLALGPTGTGVDEPRVITTLIGALEASLERVVGGAFVPADVTAKELAAKAWIYLPGDAKPRPAPTPEPTAAPDPSVGHSSDSSERTRVPQLEEALRTDPGMW